jgi:ubiquitin-protein ligase
MSDILVTIILPSGGARRAEMPDDVPIGELLIELTSLLKLPTVGPDGRPMGYRLDSKALGRELTEKETLASAGIPKEDRLMITADITAGATSLEQSPRIRRLWGDAQLVQELAARSDLIQIKSESARPGLPPEKYIVTFKCKGIISVDSKGNPQYGEKHQVEIYLHNQYPQRWPGLKWLTPIWHPNINHLNGSVCIDAAWWSASRSLDRLVIMLGEMVQYKNYHDDPTKPPFPWDPEAARWSREYRSKHPNVFPVDTQELLRPERVKLATANANQPKQSQPEKARPPVAAAKKEQTTRAEKIHLIPASSKQLEPQGSKIKVTPAATKSQPPAQPQKIKLIPNLFKKQDETKSDKAKTPPPDKDKKSHIRLK